MFSVVNADGTTTDGSSLIDEIVREGARRMLAAALEAEVNSYIAELADQRDEACSREFRRTARTDLPAGVRPGLHAGRRTATSAETYSQPRRAACRPAWNRVRTPSSLINRRTRRCTVRRCQPSCRAMASSVIPAAR